jgi:small subunit ribosomal protein S6
LREYELVLVVSPEGGEEGFPVTVERVHGFISEHGGEVKNVDQWGRRRLAYPVNRFTEGYYNITQFTLSPQDVRDLEGSLDLAEDVLRHLVVRLEEPIVVAPPRPEPGEQATEPVVAAEAPVEAPAEEAATEPAEAAAEPEPEPEVEVAMDDSEDTTGEGP